MMKLKYKVKRDKAAERYIMPWLRFEKRQRVDRFLEIRKVFFKKQGYVLRTHQVAELKDGEFALYAVWEREAKS